MVALTTCAPGAAIAQSDPAIQEENARLEAENERLRAELDALRKTAAGASTEAAVAAEEAAGVPPPSPATAPAQPKADAPPTVVAEYVPMNRISLTVSRDEAGGIRVIGTPWYRTVTDMDLLPRREFVQFRGSPARNGRPEQIWMILDRQSVQAPLASNASGQLQIGTWTGEAPIVDQQRSRRRRMGRRSTVPPRKDENTTFAFPADALEKLSLADRASFDAGPIHFEFTDEHIAAASALAARLAREEQTP